jgi:hypothetical protein
MIFVDFIIPLAATFLNKIRITYKFRFVIVVDLKLFSSLEFKKTAKGSP